MNTAIIIVLIAVALTLYSLPLDSNNDNRK
jgi:hypothetical protein|nr:MAG TPA: hypothetical protein [Caudoviricetes sp.]